MRWPGTEHLSGDVSSLTLKAITDELERRGLSSDGVLKEAGISRLTLLNPLGRIPRAAVADAAERAAHLAQDDALHLHATAHTHIGAFGVADFVVVMAPTIGAGFARVARAYGLVNAGLSFDITTRRNEAVVWFRPVFEPQLHRLDVETLMVACTTRFRSASNGRLPLLARRMGPPPRYRSVFEALLQCPIEFNQDSDSMALPLDAWAMKPHHFHPALTAMMTVFSDQAPSSESESTRELVLRHIEQRMGSPQLGASSAATACRVSERTLHRRLAAEGCSFTDLLDGVRQQRAQRHLSDETLSVLDVARLLGFADASAFTRAYKRWTGSPPRGGASPNASRSAAP